MISEEIAPNIDRILEIPEIHFIVEKVKKSRKRKTMWGIAPIAPIHLGYDSLILLQKALIDLGCDHTILLADIHAMMSHGLSFDDVVWRCNYYQYYISEICRCKPVTFIWGSHFQTRPGYIEDLYGTLTNISVAKIKDTFPTSRKNEPFFAYKVIYPIMQCLDAYHVDVDFIVAEDSQKKIYNLTNIIQKSKSLRNWIKDRMSKEILFLYIPTSHDILGQPLIVSNARTRISIHETEKSLSKKIRKMYAPPPGQEMNKKKVNAPLEFFKYSVFPWSKDPINIKTKNGYEEYESFFVFEEDYYKGIILPQDAKETLYKELYKRLSFIQEKLKEGLTFWINEKKAIGGDAL